MPDPAAPRTVRVVCDNDGPHDATLVLLGVREAVCRKCGGDPHYRGTYVATLRDPAAEALMADGERWRLKQKAYEVMPDLRGIRWNDPPAPAAPDDQA